MTVSVVYKILLIVTVYAMISELDVIFPKSIYSLRIPIVKQRKILSNVRYSAERGKVVSGYIYCK